MTSSRFVLPALLACLCMSSASAETPFFESRLIFQPRHLHSHGSCIVECPNGDLLTCWYYGSGERTADDVVIEGAWLRKDGKQWSESFLMADTVDFPDTNPCMIVDPKGRIWLMWQAIIANHWPTALFRYKISSDYSPSGPPNWEVNEIMILKPGEKFEKSVKEQLDKYLEKRSLLAGVLGSRLQQFLDRIREMSADKYSRRMGWMTRAHPFILDNKRLIIPLYSDGFSFSLMAITDDWGKTWEASLPLVGGGNVQPSIVEKKDGTLVTYMRDNGPPPKRLLMSTSKDRGMTWTEVVDSDIPNPGGGSEVTRLQNGNWALVNNDTVQGRHSLAIWISDDEGKTWKWKRHLEANPPGRGTITGGYPSIIQSKDGTIHVTYTYALGNHAKKDDQGRLMRECIKHCHFNEAWVKDGN